MQANELMIGDWVQFKDDQSFLKIEGHWALSNAKDFEPIPITAEILKKNGFIESKEVQGYFAYDMHDIGLPVLVYLMDEQDLLIRTKKYVYHGVCKYVHELQQALRLCKIDKEIQL